MANLFSQILENIFVYGQSLYKYFDLCNLKHNSYDYEYDVYQKIIFYLIFSSALLRLTYLCDDAHGDKKVLQQLLSYM